MKRLSLALISLLALSGCASVETEEATSQISSQSESESSSNQDDDQQEALGYQEIIELSYQEFLEKGMTERVESAGDNYVLSANPDSDFKAGLYNETFDDILDVSRDNLQLFTVVSAKLMLEQEDTIIEPGDNSVSLTHPDYGDFTVFFENNLIVAGESNNDGWTGTFEYSPDPETLARLN
jgi:uncharacterized protein YceK